jgi:dTMP kinase
VFEARGLAFHQSVRDAFARLAAQEPGRCTLIDAGQPAEDVAEAAWRIVSRLLDPAKAQG